MKDIAEKIAVARKENNLSQKELAKRLNVSDKLISKWETGQSVPSLTYLQNLAKELKKDYNYFFSDTEITKSKSVFVSKTAFIIYFVLLFLVVFSGVMVLANFVISPAMFTKVYSRMLDEYAENCFNGKYYEREFNFKIFVDGYEEDSQTFIEKACFYNGKAEYYYEEKPYGDIIILKDGIEYLKSVEAPGSKSELNANFNCLEDVFNYYNEDYEFDFDDGLKYIRKTAYGFYYKVDKDVVKKAFSSILGSSDVKIKKDPYGKVYIKSGSISKLTLKFTIKMEGTELDIVASQVFRKPKSKPKINHIENIDEIRWSLGKTADINKMSDVLAEGREVEKLDFQIDGGIFTDNFFVYLKNNSLYTYNLETEENKLISSDSELNRIKFNNRYSCYVYGDYIVFKFISSYSAGKLSVLNCNTGKLSQLCRGYNIEMKPTRNQIYFQCDSEKTKCYDLYSDNVYNVASVDYEIEDIMVDQNEKVYFKTIVDEKTYLKDIYSNYFEGEYLLLSENDMLYTASYSNNVLTIYEYKNKALVDRYSFDVKGLIASQYCGEKFGESFVWNNLIFANGISSDEKPVLFSLTKNKITLFNAKIFEKYIFVDINGNYYFYENIQSQPYLIRDLVMFEYKNQAYLIGDSCIYRIYNPYEIDYRIRYEHNIDSNFVVDNQNPVRYNYNTPTFTLSEPTSFYAEFIGWLKEGETVPQKVVTINQNSLGDLKFTSCWELKDFAVSYDLGIGKYDGELPKTININSNISEYLLDISDPYYNFNGWYVGEKKLESIDDIDFSSDIVITAKWGDAISFGLKYVTDIAITNSSSFPRYFDINSDINNIIKAPTPKDSYYTFLGWYCGDTLVEKISDIDLNNPTLTAKWKGETFEVEITNYYADLSITVSFNSMGGTPVDPIVLKNREKLDHGSRRSSRTGYYFNGWFKDEACTEEYLFDTDLTEDLTLYAGWVKLPENDGLNKYYSLDSSNSLRGSSNDQDFTHYYYFMAQKDTEDVSLLMLKGTKVEYYIYLVGSSEYIDSGTLVCEEDSEVNLYQNITINTKNGRVFYIKIIFEGSYVSIGGLYGLYMDSSHAPSYVHEMSLVVEVEYGKNYTLPIFDSSKVGRYHYDRDRCLTDTNGNSLEPYKYQRNITVYYEKD